MYSPTLVALTLFTASALAQVSTQTVPFSNAGTVCTKPMGPMNVTSENYDYAKKLFGNSSQPAWIASYNGDTYNGACIAFYGNTVNVPRNCTDPLPVLCDSPPTMSTTTSSPSSTAAKKMRMRRQD